MAQHSTRGTEKNCQHLSVRVTKIRSAGLGEKYPTSTSYEINLKKTIVGDIISSQ